MKEKVEIEKLIEAKIKDLNLIYNKISLLAKNRLQFFAINKHEINNEIEFSNSIIYFYYKEKERLLSEINTLCWVVGRKKNECTFNGVEVQGLELLKDISEGLYIKTSGGLGDCLLLTPALRSIKTYFPEIKVVLHCSQKAHFEVLKGNPFIDHFADESFYNINTDKFYEINVYNILPSIIYPKKVSKIICNLLDTPELEDKLEIYLSEKEIHFGNEFKSKYAPYICINPSSKCSKNQEWPEVNWVELIKKGKTDGYNFVQLGLMEETYIKGCIDLRGQLTLRESLSILNSADGYIGVDSFWAHAASALNVPAIVLFGDTNPEIWGHKNNHNIYKKTDCSPCFDLLYGQSCSYNKKCMNSIKIEEVFDSFNIFRS